MSFLDQFGPEEASSVSEYTRKIKLLLEGNVAPTWIRGEISNLRKQSSGHLYFTLKDDSSQIPVAMFRSSAAGLSFNPADGMEVLVYGEISVYEPYGRYQLIARAMSESGAGRLAREFERLKRKLSEEGLFDSESKKRIPDLPRSICVITSPTGAAIQDFIRIIKRREWRGSITVFPVKVQGVGAAAEIREAVDAADASGLFDLLIVCRGGGSLEDLWCFNDEAVARSIAAARTPIMSAVGHEIDFTLADFASDLRAETPSAAAERVTSSYIECVRNLRLLEERLDECVDGLLYEYGGSLRDLVLRLKTVAPERRLEMLSMRIDDVRARWQRAAVGAMEMRSRDLSRLRVKLSGIRPEERVHLGKNHLMRASNRMETVAKQNLNRYRSRIDLITGHLEGLSPQATLNRGYAALTSMDGKALTRTTDLPEAEDFKAILKDGEVRLKKSGSES